MKAFRACVSLAVFSLGVLAPLQSASASDAETLASLVESASPSLPAAKASFSPFLDKARKQGLPPEAIKELSDAAEEFFQTTLADPGLHAELVKSYEDAFTPEELASLAAFYSTPAGRKALTLMPQISKQSETISQKYAAKHQELFQEQLRAIYDRYQNNSQAKDAPPKTGDKTPSSR